MGEGRVENSRRLAAELGQLLDELLLAAGHCRVGAWCDPTPSQLLLALGQAPGSVPVAALAHPTRLSVASTGRLVEHLRRQGLVSRHEGSRDRPGQQVEITPAGRAHLRALEAERRRRLERYVDRLGCARQLRLAGALHLLSGRLDGDLAHPESRTVPDAF